MFSPPTSTAAAAAGSAAARVFAARVGRPFSKPTAFSTPTSIACSAAAAPAAPPAAAAKAEPGADCAQYLSEATYFGTTLSCSLLLSPFLINQYTLTKFSSPALTFSMPPCSTISSTLSSSVGSRNTSTAMFCRPCSFWSLKILPFKGSDQSSLLVRTTYFPASSGSVKSMLSGGFTQVVARERVELSILSRKFKL